MPRHKELAIACALGRVKIWTAGYFPSHSYLPDLESSSAVGGIWLGVFVGLVADWTEIFLAVDQRNRRNDRHGEQ